MTTLNRENLWVNRSQFHVAIVFLHIYQYDFTNSYFPVFLHNILCPTDKYTQNTLSGSHDVYP